MIGAGEWDAVTEILRGCAAGADRFVVVDTETTGLYNSDRVVEIAIYTLSLDGDLLEIFDTLVNPRRDVSASHIHGITATMVKDAPTFEEIAGDVAVRLHGACLVAHNVPFDKRMLRNEYQRIGTDLEVLASVDTYVASGRRLIDACGLYGIDLGGGHRASTDARATAELFLRLAAECERGGPLAAPVELGRSGRVRRRDDVAAVTLPEPALITFLASRISLDGLAVRSQMYLEMVGRGVADLHLDRDERAELAALALSLDLNMSQVAQAHRRFVNGLIDAAIEDDIVTDDEYDTLVRIAAALDVDQGAVERRISAFRSVESQTVLTDGMQIVFTGDHPDHDRDDLVSHAVSLGLNVTGGVSKSTSLVCAADPASESGKATKARRYGIPVVAAGDFIRARIGDTLAATGAGQTGLKVITCPDCLVTSTVPATAAASNRKCEGCARIAKQAAPVRRVQQTSSPASPTGPTGTWAPPAIEWLTCRSCTSTWHRQVSKGRKPHHCPTCVGTDEIAPPA